MIIVKSNDPNIEEIICDSMYEAHTWKIYLDANGYECDVIIDGKSTSLPEDIQHPSTYYPLNQSKMTDENYEKLRGIRDIAFAVLIGGSLLAISIFIFFKLK